MTSRRHDVTTSRQRRVAVVNHKGGTAKTTTAVNLAAALAERGDRVLVVDLDGACSASSWLGVADDGDALLAVFADGAPFVVRPSTVAGVDAVASSGRMSALDRKVDTLDAVAALRAAVARLDAVHRWLLLDCPGTLGTATVAALAVATDVLVPVEPGPLAVAQLPDVLRAVDRVRETLAPDLALARIVPVRVDMRTNLAASVVDRLRVAFGDAVTRTTVRESVRIRECPAARQPITTYDTRGPGAADYRALAAELDGGGTP